MDSPIFRLAASGDYQREALELHLGSLNSLSRLESSPLHYAILGGNEETVRFLVSRGARVRASNMFNETPLHWACKEGNLSVVQFLLQQGAVPDSLDTEGNTPMHWAAEYDREKVILLLLEYGTHSSRLIENEDDHTPLQVAKENGSKRALKVLQTKIFSSSHPLLTSVTRT